MSEPAPVLPEVRLLTVKEVASLLRVSNMTVYRLVKLGDLKALHVGRSIRLLESSVVRYLEPGGEHA